jgi:MFS family permease
VYGFISDSFPIFNYRRKPYLFITGIIVTICWILMSFWAYTVNKAVILLFITSICTAFYNVIGEALVVELSQSQKNEDPEAGSKNVSLFFLTRSSASLFAALISGSLIEIISKRQGKKI